jgi:PKHD-type hydroxylase
MTTLSNFAFNTLLFTPSKVILHNQFTDEEIDSIVDYCKRMPLNEGGTFNNTDPYATRKAKTAFIEYPDHNTQWIYDRYNKIVEYYNDTLFKFDLTGFNYIQYAEYGPEGRHNFHMDIGLDTPKLIDYRINEHLRKITIVTLLSTPNVDFTGGEFQLNLSEERFPIDTGLQKGSVILIPSYILHRVSPVLSGLRRTLTTWVIGPKFK